jgi:NitT/TauT family transport system ATP-binding protein
MTTTDTALLGIEHLSVTYGTGDSAYRALKDITFRVTDGEVVTVVGPSGAGKTTLLKTMCGLMAPTSGTVSFAGTPVAGVPDGLAVVFQDYARSLYAWFSVRRNVSLPLEAAGLPRKEIAERVDDALRAVGLADAGHKKPYQLSGGMQQRVAIARALEGAPHGRALRLGRRADARGARGPRAAHAR